MTGSRTLVFFPVDQFFALTGEVHTPFDPYTFSIPDILSQQSAATHGARDHVHNPGRIYVRNVSFYALQDNSCRVCESLDRVHIRTSDLRAVIDVHPERYRGSDLLRREASERSAASERIRFLLHGHLLSGCVDPRDVYRRSEDFIGVHRLAIEESDAAAGLSLPGFLEFLGCPAPDFMAVNLSRVLHT